MEPAVIAKMLPPAGKQPARYKAFNAAGAVFEKLGDYDGNESECCRAAFLRLCKRLKMTGQYQAGTLPDGRVVFVKVNGSAVDVA